jgi:beta-galactosidase/beta-glucuronidase
VTITAPKPEHPRPQLVRPEWVTLNGEWQFEVDAGDSGLERGLLHRELRQNIVVPFAPESIASGVHDTDFLHAVWYRRTVTIPDSWRHDRVLLHFGAVDHDATVWVDGVEAARHRGGFTPFTVDLGARSPGEQLTVVVRARDSRDAPQARGKQATWYANSACFYTRTTGIWQTVWLEGVPRTYIRSLNLVPSVADSSLQVGVDLIGMQTGLTVEAVLSDGAGEVARVRRSAAQLGAGVRLSVPDDRLRLWSPADPHLYDLEVRLWDGERVVDTVASYAGLRSIAVEGHRILINGEPVFQRLVLDQGYWPDTLMTSPDDASLRRDIELAMAAGFNGARLHQKVFEERYLYHADRLGYLVWAEFGDWGATVPGDPGNHQQPTASFVGQWIEAVVRDRSHPSIVGWCPMNETYQVLHDRITQLDDVTGAMYLATKAADPTRPVIDASGYSHRVRGADVYDGHDYEQDPVRFAANHAGLAEGAPHVNTFDGATISLPYEGQPYFVSEYGGIWWNPRELERPQQDANDPARDASWGYGQRVADIEEWYARYQGLTDVLLGDPRMFGYCFTQLTDTFQEENGIYDFHRRPKFDIERIRAVQMRPAAFEVDVEVAA